MDIAEKPAVDILDDRSDFVKKLDEIDVHNLSPEDERFLYDSVQGFFMENFPVDKELVDQIPEKTVILDHEKFVEAYLKTESNPEGDVPVGFYDIELDKSFVDYETIGNAAGVLSTIFHESLHFVSMSQGAGFKLSGADFRMPENDDYLKDFTEDERKYYGSIADKTVVEGSTKIMELSSMEDMGIDVSEDGGYNIEKQIMSEVLCAMVPEYDQLKSAYFTKSTEDIRKAIESSLLSPEDKEKYQNGEIPTGKFVLFMLNIGAAADKMHQYYKQDDPDSYFEVLDGIHDSMQEYLDITKERRNV